MSGPWFVALIEHSNKRTVYCHTYAHQYASLMNGIHGVKTWKTISLAGPFDTVADAREWSFRKAPSSNVTVWEITHPKPVKRKRLTLDMLDGGELTIEQIRLILAQ